MIAVIRFRANGNIDRRQAGPVDLNTGANWTTNTWYWVAVTAHFDRVSNLWNTYSYDMEELNQDGAFNADVVGESNLPAFGIHAALYSGFW